MHFSTVLSLFLFITLINAQPMVPRQDENVHDESCTIMLPSSYQQIIRSSPQISFPQNHTFNVVQATGGNDNVDTLLRFSGIPPRSYGCQLAMSFAVEYPIHGNGSTQLNIYALPRPVSSTDTYATYYPDGGRGTPEDSYLWATTTITGARAVINSVSCRPDLGYLFQIASETEAGSVRFTDAGNNLSGIGGFYLTYDC